METTIWGVGIQGFRGDYNQDGRFKENRYARVYAAHHTFGQQHDADRQSYQSGETAFCQSGVQTTFAATNLRIIHSMYRESRVPSIRLVPLAEHVDGDRREIQFGHHCNTALFTTRPASAWSGLSCEDVPSKSFSTINAQRSTNDGFVSRPHAHCVNMAFQLQRVPEADQSGSLTSCEFRAVIISTVIPFIRVGRRETLSGLSPIYGFNIWLA